MAAPTYDPEILRESARRLYAAARALVVQYVIVGGLIGAAAGYGAQAAGVFQLSPDTRMQPIVLGCISAVLAGFSGWAASFKLRAEAQIALALVAIDERLRDR